MGKQPGVMLYFDIRPCLARLTMDEQGMLFNAILNYGEDGIEPNFNYMLGIAWDFIKPRLERDRERYEEKVQKSQYAIYVRERKKLSIAPLSYEEWIVAGCPMPSDDIEWYPTTTSTPNTNSSSSSEAMATPPDFVQQTDCFVQQIVENSC